MKELLQNILINGKNTMDSHDSMLKKGHAIELKPLLAKPIFVTCTYNFQKIQNKNKIKIYTHTTVHYFSLKNHSECRIHLYHVSHLV